jgi:hypothetical protein
MPRFVNESARLAVRLLGGGMKPRRGAVKKLLTMFAEAAMVCWAALGNASARERKIWS